MKPILYYQSDGKGNPIWDFAAIAKMGAEELGIETKEFEESFEIPYNPYKIIVGSVEECKSYLEENGLDVPESIQNKELLSFMKRDSIIGDKESIGGIYDSINIGGKVFIKPANSVKSFTGQVVYSKEEMFNIIEGCNEFLLQSVIDIDSEYRLYIRGGRVIGMKHYIGDPLLFPDPEFINDCIKGSNFLNKTHSAYTLDFGVSYKGETMLIEANDAWAIGNYGLEPRDYYYFVRDRWLQITGVTR